MLNFLNSLLGRMEKERVTSIEQFKEMFLPEIQSGNQKISFSSWQYQLSDFPQIGKAWIFHGTQNDPETEVHIVLSFRPPAQKPFKASVLVTGGFIAQSGFSTVMFAPRDHLVEWPMLYAKVIPGNNLVVFEFLDQVHVEQIFSVIQMGLQTAFRVIGTTGRIELNVPLSMENSQLEISKIMIERF